MRPFAMMRSVSVVVALITSGGSALAQTHTSMVNCAAKPIQYADALLSKDNVEGSMPEQCGTIEVEIGHTRLLKLDRQFKFVIVGNPDVADAVVQDERTLLITAKVVGEAQAKQSDNLHVGSNPKDNQVTVGADPSAAPSPNNPSSETYRGFFLDLTAITDRQDFATIVDELRHQVDIVESVGLNQRVLQSFHTVPILVDEFGCLGSEAITERPEKPVMASGCYGARVPGNLANNEDLSHGVVVVRPVGLKGPVVLHELLHFYHAHMFPQGVEEPAIRFYYTSAKSIYKDTDGYALRNEKEFFAVTASIFLYGRDEHEPFTRAQLKENQPEYYNYLVWLFGFDPRTSPFASAN